MPVDLTAYSECLRRDAAYHAFVAGYAVFGLVLGITAGVPHKFVPLSYVGAFAGVPYQLLAIVVAGIGIWSLRSPRPARTFGELLGKVISPQIVAGLVLSGPHRVDRLYVGGEGVVRDGHLVRADEADIARVQRLHAGRLAA